VTSALLDDHLLRDHLAGRPVPEADAPATTNLFYVRLCRSVVAARGGTLTGAWSPAERQALGRALVALPDDVSIVPMADLAFRMAELAAEHGLSTLGAEAVAAAERLGVPLQVWAGDDGPRIRSAAAAVGVDYRAVAR
jgi:hypothetical protein